MKNIYTKIVSIFLSGLFLITGFVDMLSYKDRFPQDFKQEFLMIGSLERSQDITTDGNSLYSSWRMGLAKTDMDGNIIKRNFLAIPKELSEKYGTKHIGGISYYNGKIYAAGEDSKVFDYPIVMVFDAQTLNFTGEYHVLDKEVQKKGLPWVSVDGENGLVYSAQRDDAPVIVCYDISTFEIVKKIQLSEPIHKIQGGEVFDGKLYVATNNEFQSVYSVDVGGGEVTKLFDRNLTKLSEGEGLTIISKDGKDYIATLDLGSLFINANIRYFRLEQFL